MHFHRDVLAICDAFPPSSFAPTKRRRLHRHAAARVHVRARRTAALSAARRRRRPCCSESSPPDVLLAAIAAYGATVCHAAPTAYRAMTPLVRQARPADAARVRLGGRDAAGRHPRGVGDGDRHQDHRRHRLDRDAAHLHLGDRRRDPARRDRHAGPGLRGLHPRRRGPAGCRRASSAGSRSRARPAAVTSTTSASRSTCRTAGTSPATHTSCDEDGYYWYQARSDDMIISSGYNIAGPEVEQALLAHAAVAECAVVGVPDEERGQLVKAFVVAARRRCGRRRARARTAGVRQGADRAVQVSARDRIRRRAAARPQTGKLQRFRLRAAAGETHRDDPSTRRAGRARAATRPASPRSGTVVYVSGQIGWDADRSLRLARLRGRRCGRRCETSSRCWPRPAAGPEHIVRMTWYVTEPHRVSRERRRRSGLPTARSSAATIPAMSVVEVAALIEGRGESRNRGYRHAAERTSAS